MKHYYVVILAVVLLAACSSPVHTLDTHVEEFWGWNGEAGKAGDLKTQHAACEATKKPANPPLLQVKTYMDCMTAKGWKTKPAAWQKLAASKKDAAK